ncbi:MAG: EscU/YscU/HrcU family type III secretion system export apparatus switch protein [Armatimonadota bacterium]|nr:MAG: EscU/YscU/HrcU family type III secretion system export apparatus switch protein [Armatimonadota bacterium]
MAEERTEQATPRRREEARQRGEVPRSGELAGAAGLLGALLGLRLGWPSVVEAARETALWGMGECGRWEPTVGATVQLIETALACGGRMVLPVAAGACAAAAAVNLGQSGFLISAHPLGSSWRRLSLIEGIKRICSRRGMFSLVRSLVKLAAVGAVVFLFVRGRWESVLGLAQGSALGAAAGIGVLIWGLLLRVAGVMVVVAVADYIYQRREYDKNLRMSRYELKEEYKRTEGDPLTRSRVREKQRALARHRMLEAVKHATAVVTNPVEIAVALRYEVEKMPAPVVVAKGRWLMAERIKAQARKHGVPVTESPDLARALYRSVAVGRQIPPELYQAVAEILAFVYRITGRGPTR